MGRIGSGVRISVSFQQKCPPGSVLRCPTAADNGGYDLGCLSGGGFGRTPPETIGDSRTEFNRILCTSKYEAAVTSITSNKKTAL